MPTYASNTSVSIESSRGEIERILRRYGADSFMYGWSGDQAVLGFDFGGRRYKMVLKLPPKKDFIQTETGRTRRSANSVNEAYEQAIRQRWRAMALWIKAVLEADECGIITLEQALQPFTMLPDGRTVGEWMAPQIRDVYDTGKMPPLLPGLLEGG